MHQQIRVRAPAASPPSVESVLKIVRDKGVNIIAAGGSNVEFDGEFAFSVPHGEENGVMDALRQARLEPRLVDVTVCWLEKGRPGGLHGCIAQANRDNRRAGKLIRDISIGEPDDQGRIPVQLFYETGG